MNFQLLVEEILEEAGRCTGPTKKASSDSKGKKVYAVCQKSQRQRIQKSSLWTKGSESHRKVRKHKTEESISSKTRMQQSQTWDSSLPQL